MHRALRTGRAKLNASRPRGRRGLTLVELLMASTIMTLVVGGLAALAITVEAGSLLGQGRATTLQHARVVVDRIERTLKAAYANASFPGFAAFSEQISGADFPDTLVVWKPAGAAANPDGLPLFSEIVVYCPDPADPTRLLEITDETDHRTVPALSDLTSWDSELETLRNNVDASRVQLTDLVRTAELSLDTGPPIERAALRFAVRLHPTDAQWNAYPSSVNWQDLPWAQSIYGSQSGLRQAWCRFEIQLVQGQRARLEDPLGQTVLPFFGSAALYYELRK